MKKGGCFKVLIILCALAAILSFWLQSQAGAGSSQAGAGSQEAGECDGWEGSTCPEYVSSPSVPVSDHAIPVDNLSGSFSQMYFAIQAFFIAFGESALTVLVSTWNASPEAGRCFIGMFLVVTGLLALTGLVAVRTWSGLWRRYIS